MSLLSASKGLSAWMVNGCLSRKPTMSFVGLMRQRASRGSIRLGPEEGPFSPQQPLSPPPWCWNVEESAWCPSINLGKSPGKQRSWQPAPLSSPLHIPSSISSLCWVSHETLFSEPQMASSQSLTRQLCLPPSPQAFSFLTWFPRKGLSLSIFLPLCFSLSVSVSLSVPYSF